MNKWKKIGIKEEKQILKTWIRQREWRIKKESKNEGNKKRKNKGKKNETDKEVNKNKEEKSNRKK